MTAHRDLQEDEDTPLVPFIAFRCPQCSRHKPRTYAVRGRMRYHRCLACGCKYRSLEVDASVLPDWPELPHGGARA